MKSRLESRIVRTAAVLLVGTGLAVSSALAQQDAPPPPPDQTQGPPPNGSMGPGSMRHGPSIDRRVEMLKNRLNLTPDQTTQIRSILEGEHSRMEALHSNASLSPQDRHTQMMSIHQDSESRIRATLTSEQAATFDQMQARQRERMQNHERGEGPGGNGAGDNGAPPPPPPPPPPPQ
jgi:Spy/CpxP family protein refolding chaperone